jgi:hypothetical protein
VGSNQIGLFGNGMNTSGVNWWDFLQVQPRRKVFVSYHHDGDQHFYNEFLQHFDKDNECITDNSLSRLFDSENPEYVMQRIRDTHITGSSCTVVLCGSETPWRKYVDWEIKSTLDKEHSLIGVCLPTARHDGNGRVIVPQRLFDNFQSGYAHWVSWESLTLGPAFLKLAIEIAALKSRNLISNSQEIMKRNGTPPVPGYLDFLRLLNTYK